MTDENENGNGRDGVSGRSGRDSGGGSDSSGGSDRGGGVESDSDDQAQERRTIAHPKARERRYIKRLSEPQLRRNIQQIVTFARLILGFAAVYAVVIFATAFQKDILGRTRSFFIIVATLLFSIGLWFFERAAVSYLSNESIERLVIALEKMRNFLLVILVLVYVFGATHLISLF